MSKRHGAVSVKAYREEGFLQGAFVNYLARLGWNDGTDREIYTLTDLESLFSLEQVSSSPASFDREKLLWFNGKYIRTLSDEELYTACLPFLGEFVKVCDINDSTCKWLAGLIALYRDRIEVLSEISETLRLYFQDPRDYSEEELQKAKVTGEAFNALKELKKIFADSEWTVENLEKTVKEYIERKQMKMKAVLQPLRLVITGTLATPGIFDTLYYIGKEPTLRRLEYFLANYRPPGKEENK